MKHIDRVRAEELLQLASLAQSTYWSTVRALEKALGCEIDDARDLSMVTIDYLLKKGKR